MLLCVASIPLAHGLGVLGTTMAVSQVAVVEALLERRVLVFYFQALSLSKSERAKRHLSSELCKHGTWFSDLPFSSRALASPSRASLLSLASASLT